MMNIALFGPPGAGKGTQAKRIVEKYSLEHISTGDIIRREIAAGSELGKMAKGIIDKGELLSDEFVIILLEDAISKSSNTNGFLFDGFPRTVNQAEQLDKMLEKKGTPLKGLINIAVPFDELMIRMVKRAEIEGRADDTPEVIENRFKVYNEQTKPVEEHYRKKGLSCDINGNQGMEEVFGEIVKVMAKL